MSPIVIIILGTLLVSGMLWIKTVPAHRKGAAVFKLLILVLVAIIVILTVTGRLHWIGALAAGCFLLYKKYNAVLKVAPILRFFFGKKGKHSTQQPSHNSQMTRQEALKVLDLEEGCSSQEIIQAHRKLMQKLHPDHGGNSYLAAQVNEARAVLLNK